MRRCNLSESALIASLVVAIVAMLAGNLAGPAIVLVWISATRAPWSTIGFVPWPQWKRDVALAALGGIFLKLLLKTLVLPPLGVPAVNSAYAFVTGNETALAGMLALAIVGGGFGEEVVWRGFLFDRLGALLGRTNRAQAAIVAIGSVLFGLAHLHDQGWPGVIQSTITGAVFGTAFVLLGRIWPIMIAHAAFDVTALLVIYWGREEWLAHLIWRGK